MGKTTKKNKKENENDIIPNQGPGTVGYVYSNTVALYILLKTLNIASADFEFGQEHQYAKNFDDIVVKRVEVSEKEKIPYRFMQLKYTEDNEKKLDKNMLLDSYSLHTHFAAFSQIKYEDFFNDIDMSEFMLILNIDVEEELKLYLEEKRVENDVYFNLEGTFKLFKVNFASVDNFILDIKTNLLSEILKKKRLDENVIKKLGYKICHDFLEIFNNDTKKQGIKISEKFLNSYNPSEIHINKLKRFSNKDHNSIIDYLKQYECKFDEDFLKKFQKEKSVESLSLDDELIFFLKQFYIVKTPNYVDLYKHIREELCKFIELEFINVEIVEWALKSKMFYIIHDEERILRNRDFWKDEIYRLVNMCPKMALDLINKFKIKKECEKYNFKKEALLNIKRKYSVINFVTPKTIKITKLKLFCSLDEEEKKNSTFGDLQDSPELIRRATEIFFYKYLVIYQEKNVDNNLLYEIINLAIQHNKTVILLTREEIKPRVEWEEFYTCQQIQNTFADFSKHVKFPGKLIFQGSELDLRYSDDAIKQIVNDEVLVRLMSGENVEIGNGILRTKNYIKFVDRRVEIKRTGDEDDEPLFDYETSEFIFFCEKSNFLNNDDLITIKKTLINLNASCNKKQLDSENFVIVTDDGYEFERFCERDKITKNCNVHWLSEYFDDSYMWMCTKGSKGEIVKLISGAAVKVQSIESLEDTVVLLKAKAGFGKSVILKHVAKNSASQENWIVFLELRKLSENLDRLVNEEITEEIAMQFVRTAAEIRENFETNFFKHYYEKSRVSLMIDGFDEIVPTYAKISLELLKKLTAMNFKKIWITTRPYNIAKELEFEIGAKSYDLLPFDAAMSEEFFKIHMKDEDKNFNKEYFSMLMSALEKYINKDALTSPLNCSMIVDTLKKNFRDELRDRDSIFVTADKEKLSQFANECTLHRRFVREKLLLHFQDKYNLGKHDSDAMMKNFEKAHTERYRAFALQSLFAPEQLDELRISPCLEIDEGELIGGLVDTIIDGKVFFVHQSFAEYLAAEYFVERLSTVTGFLTKILYDDDRAGVRRFFDDILMNDVELHRLIKGRTNDGDHYELHTNILNLAAKVNETDAAGRTPLMTSVMYGNVKVTSLLLRLSADPSIIDRFGFTAIEYAVRLSKPEHFIKLLPKYDAQFVFDGCLLSTLITNIEDVVFLERLLVNLQEKFNEDIYRNALLECLMISKAVSMQIVVLTDFVFERLYPEQTRRTLRHLQNYGYVHSERNLAAFSENVVEWQSFGLSDCDKIKYGSYFVAKYLLLNAKTKCAELNEIFSGSNYVSSFLEELAFLDGGRCELHRLLKNKDSIKIALYLGKNMQNVDCKDGLGRTPLMLAVLYYPYVVPELLTNKVNIEAVDFFHFTAIKYAVKSSEWNIVAMMLSHFPKGVNDVDSLSIANPREVLRLIIKKCDILLIDYFFKIMNNEKHRNNENLIEIVIEAFCQTEKLGRNVVLFNNIKTFFDAKQLSQIIDVITKENNEEYTDTNDRDKLLEDLYHSSIDTLFPDSKLDIAKRHEKKKNRTFINETSARCCLVNYIAEQIKLGKCDAINFYNDIMFQEQYDSICDCIDILLTQENEDCVLHYSFVTRRIKKLGNLPKKCEEDKNNKDFFGRTPLMLAISYDHMVKELLKYGADIHEKDRFGNTVVKYGIYWENWSSLEFIMCLHDNVSIEEIFHFREKNIIMDLIESIFKKGYPFLTNELILAIADRRDEMFMDLLVDLFIKKLLSKSGIDDLLLLITFTLMKYYNTQQLYRLLNVTMVKNNINQINCVNYEKLLADLTRSSFMAIFGTNLEQYPSLKEFVASERHSINVNKKFIEYFVSSYLADEISSKSSDAENIFKDIMFDEQYQKIRRVVDMMLTKNYKLHSWIILKKSDIKSKYLQNTGRKEVNSKDILERTPLMLAILYNRKYVEELIKAGADVNASDKYSFTALHYAIKSECLSSAEKIFHAGFDLTKIDSNVFSSINKNQNIINFYKKAIKKGYTLVVDYLFEDIVNRRELTEKVEDLISLFLKVNEIPASLIISLNHFLRSLNLERLYEFMDKITIGDCFYRNYTNEDRLIDYLRSSSLNITHLDTNIVDTNVRYTFVNEFFHTYFSAECLVARIKCGDDEAINILYKAMFDKKYGTLCRCVDLLLNHDKEECKLHYRIARSNWNHTSVFLNSDKLNVNSVDALGRTSLMLAVKSFHAKDFSYRLIDSGADVEAVDCRNHTVLTYAIKSANWSWLAFFLVRYPEKTTMLLEQIRENPSIIGKLQRYSNAYMTPLTFNLLKTRTVEIEVDSILALTMSTDDSERLCYSSMVALFPDANFSGGKVLETVANREFAEFYAAKYLVGKIVSGDEEAVSFFDKIMFDREYAGMRSSVDLLLVRDVEACELHFWIHQFDISYVRAYLSNGEKVKMKNNVDILGRTPLMMATFETECKVKLLLELGVEVDCKDVYGRTALDYANLLGEDEIAEAISDYKMHMSKNENQ